MSTTSVEAQKVIKELERTARKTSRTATELQILILLLLGLGVYVIFYAGDITKRDTDYLTDDKGNHLTTDKGDSIVLSKEPQRVTDIMVWQSTITRLGTVSLIIYLVKILLGASRYASRRSAYAEARKHAITLGLALSESEVQRIADFAKVFDADRLDMGKEPSSPTEELRKLAQAVKGAQSD